MIQRLKKIQCPHCEEIDWQVAIGTEELPRIILDCSVCQYRLSLPTDDKLWETTSMFKCMPIEFSKEEVES